MSLSKPAQAASLERYDAYNPLAVARYLPSSPRGAEFLRRVVRLLSTTAGPDKILTIISYGFPMLAFLLSKSTAWSAKLLPYTGGKLSTAGTRRGVLAASLQALASKASDLRMGYRLFGLVPMIAWLISLEKAETQPKDWKTRNIKRLQVWSMLAYYPLEHAYYLSTHKVISMSDANRLKAIMWACRAWACYVFLDLYEQSRNARQLSKKMAYISARREEDRRSATPVPGMRQSEKDAEKDITKVDAGALVDQGSTASEEAALIMNERECIEQSRTLINAAMINIAYAPLAIHWSLANGLFTNSPLWVGIFGSIAGFVGLKTHWKATA